MVAAISRIVDANHYLTPQQPLDTEIPLEDVRILRRRSAEIITVRVTPLRREITVLLPLRASQSAGEWIGECRGAGIKVILREKHGCALTERGSRILEVGRHAHAVVNTGAAPGHGIGIQLIGKAEARPNVVSVYRNASHTGCGKQCNSVQFFRSLIPVPVLGGPAAGQVNTLLAAAIEIAEFDSIVSRSV